MPAVPPNVTLALARLRARLEARFSARLREVVLFGSYARGTPHEESDVDLLVVVDDLTHEERIEILGLAYEVDSTAAGEDGYVCLSPLAYSTAHAADMRGREKLLMRDIAREGIPV
jgi:predicted nucleotidyltransferase